MKVLKNNLAKNDIFVISGYGPKTKTKFALLVRHMVIGKLYY
jgi:hypothetical protein